MPLYNYRCKACDKVFETLVMSSSEVVTCPACNAAELERLIGTVAAEAKSPGLVKNARAQAAREGHFSNYSRSELKRR